MHADQDNKLAAKDIVITGVVQGVGFRPFIYQHARRYGLCGWVRNTSGKVRIRAQGMASSIDEFIHSLLPSAPAISSPQIQSVVSCSVEAFDDFDIVESAISDQVDIHLPADLATCDECMHELNDASNARYRYPFINCTQCGPRYTIIDSLPYDRSSTSMAMFELCDHCDSEYRSPGNRRYHAEPVACESCGPSLRAVSKDVITTGNEASIKACAEVINQGGIVAIKGIGGYHLACDAGNSKAIRRLRKLKPRPHKPLAVMVNEQDLERYFSLNDGQRKLIHSPARPVVLLQARQYKKNKAMLSHLLSPGLVETGVMLPYSPLHHLILQAVAKPLVMTSANISGEPVLTDNREVSRRLGHVADMYLHHDRNILRPADDSVYREIAGQCRPVRLGRGISPLELELPFNLERPVLAVGAHMKNTITLAWGNRAVMSPHIGDLESMRGIKVFENTVADIQQLYQVNAEKLLCDMHPAYASTRWAMRQDIPAEQIYHHHAHASATWFEASRNDNNIDKMLVFTWDGVGLGEDNNLWGGDALLGSPANWQRVASLRPFRLPGGERAGREPWRSAAGMCWEVNTSCPLPESESELLHSFWREKKNSPKTTSVGRLFDAASALTGLCSSASFEGQGPMWLEAAAHGDVEPVDLPVYYDNGLHIADWAPLLDMLRCEQSSLGYRAGCFHSSMAYSLLRQAVRIRLDHGVNHVGLSGGVFQNRLLTEMVIRLLEDNDFNVTMPLLIPVNDAGISLGQVIDMAYR